MAPAHVVIAVDVGRYRERYAESDKTGLDAWTVPYWWADAGAALMLILLAAVDEGLAAGFLGSHAIDDLAATVGFLTDSRPSESSPSDTRRTDRLWGAQPERDGADRRWSTLSVGPGLRDRLARAWTPVGSAAHA